MLQSCRVALLGLRSAPLAWATSVHLDLPSGLASTDDHLHSAACSSVSTTAAFETRHEAAPQPLSTPDACSCQPFRTSTSISTCQASISGRCNTVGDAAWLCMSRSRHTCHPHSTRQTAVMMAASPWPASLRHASTLTKAGIPKPRPEFESAMSTARGGHIARSITFTQTMHELEQFVRRNESAFQTIHWAAAALQLERLSKLEQSSPYGLRLKSIATRIETATAASAFRLAAIHLAPILRGLTGAGHAMAPATLTAYAASLIARDCAQLRLANDVQWKYIVQGFALQGYTNPVLWKHLGVVAAEKLPGWEVNRASSVWSQLVQMGVRNDTLNNTAMASIQQQAAQLRPPALVNALHTVALLHRPTSTTSTTPTASLLAGSLDEQLVSTLRQQALSQLSQFDSRSSAWFLSSLAQLGAGSQEVARQVVSTALTHTPGVMQPWFVQRLLAAALTLGYKDAGVTEQLAGLALPELADMAHPQRVQLLETVLQGVEGAGKLPEKVQELQEAVRQLEAAEQEQAQQ